MSMQDPISDLLTRIRNAHSAGKREVQAPFSKQKEAIVKVLESEGYVESYSVRNEKPQDKLINVTLKYYEGKPVINKLKRISKPGLRNYVAVSEIPKVLGGLGMAIMSTSKGVVSGAKAAKLGHGGEVLCFVE